MNEEIMSRTSFVIFSIFVLFSCVILQNNAFADTTAKSINFEKTTIIEFENNDNIQIKTIKMWLGKESGIFKSFKTENNWIGAKTPQEMLVFSTESPLKSGESVKFGIKTEIANPGINWKTIDSNGNDVTIGKTTTITEQTPPEQVNTPVSPPTKSNFDSATFRIIPEKPKNGDSIRIIGDGFSPNQHLDFYIDNEKLDDFTTDNRGHLIAKSKIPISTKSERIELSLVDKDSNKKTISIRVEYVENQPASPKLKHITVTEFPEIVQPGQTVQVSGTGKPGNTLTITTKDPAGNKISEITTPVDIQGNWFYATIIPPDVGIGSRLVEISDGSEVITKTVSITILKTVHLKSSLTQYEPGNTMSFNGTAIAGKPIEIVIKDPIGKEIFSDILPVDDSGFVKFELSTDAASIKGTYVILATQGQDTDIIRVGLGEPPGQSIVAKFDKLNYATSDKAKIIIQGPASAKVSILILDPSDKLKATDSTTLGLDGNKDYEIDLSTYKSGVYSTIIKYQKSQAKEMFSVGLQRGAAGEIKMQATKQTYTQGNSILVLGSAKPNSLLNLKLSDPSGNTIRQKEIFTDKNGKFSDSAFRIPADGAQGIWVIRAESGANYADVKVNVATTMDKLFTIITDKTTYKPKDIVKISGVGGGKSQTVVVTILDSNNKEMVKLNAFSTSEGIFKIDWPTPSDITLGEYKVSVKTGNVVAETTFSIQ